MMMVRLRCTVVVTNNKGFLKQFSWNVSLCTAALNDKCSNDNTSSFIYSEMPDRSCPVCDPFYVCPPRNNMQARCFTFKLVTIVDVIFWFPAILQTGCFHLIEFPLGIYFFPMFLVHFQNSPKKCTILLIYQPSDYRNLGTGES